MEATINNAFPVCGIFLRKFAWISFAKARMFSQFFQQALGDLHFSTLFTNNEHNQRKSWGVNFHDHHHCASRSHNESILKWSGITAATAIWGQEEGIGRRHGNLKGRCACKIIYGSPWKAKKILFERLFSCNKKIKLCCNRGQTKSVLNCIWNQIQNKPQEIIAQYDRLNVTLRAAEIRFA